jgi:hypothetical protein
MPAGKSAHFTVSRQVHLRDDVRHLLLNLPAAFAVDGVLQGRQLFVCVLGQPCCFQLRSLHTGGGTLTRRAPPATPFALTNDIEHRPVKVMREHPGASRSP